MQRLDRAAISRFQIPRLLLMEHAGLAVARAVRSLAKPPATIVACCGSGYNGGDGLCAVRHLAGWGYHPQVALTVPAGWLKDEPAVYAKILQRLQVPMLTVTGPAQRRRLAGWLRQSRVVLDALLGIGLSGPVRPQYAEMITLMNRANRPIIAVDVPSGLDADSGEACPVAVRATVTVTFGLPKRGCFTRTGQAYTGRLVVDPIGFPPQLLQQVTG